MIKRNDLKDILHRAGLDASKPTADEAWGDMLASLDEQMPEKKKKRRFFPLIFLMGGLIVFLAGILSYVSPDKKDHVANTDAQAQIATRLSPNTIQSTKNSETGSLQNTETSLSKHHSSSSQHTNPEIKSPVAEKNRTPHAHNGIKKSPGKDISGKDAVPTHSGLTEAESGIPTPPKHEFGNPFHRLSPKLLLAGILHLSGSFMTLHRADTSLSMKVKKDPKKKDSLDQTADADKDKKGIQKRHIAIGGTLGYTFNNFTSTENRSSAPLLNTAYQAYKQIGMSIYGRIPVSRFYQVQPELGIEPTSCNIQINYKTIGQNDFSRYNLKRMVYAQFGIMNYLEIRKNLYVTAGAYYAYAMPFYGARLDLVRQGPGNMEQVMQSSYERTDFRRNVFGLRRNDIGISGGIEYHIGHISSSIRLSRGFMDITPETASMYHNFNISCRIGYHFEFVKR